MQFIKRNTREVLMGIIGLLFLGLGIYEIIVGRVVLMSRNGSYRTVIEYPESISYSLISIVFGLAFFGAFLRKLIKYVKDNKNSTTGGGQ